MAITPTSSGAAPIQITGLISGLDSTSIVQKLVELEKAPVTSLQNKQAAISDQVTAWQTLNTKLLTLNTAVHNLNTNQKFRGTNGTFTNSISGGGNIVNMSTTGNAGSGTYSFAVNNLAAQHKMQSATGYSSATASAGISGMTITKGGVSQSFTQSSLQDLSSAINSSSLGITASIVNGGSSDAPSYRMLLTSNDTGANQSFTVSTVPGQNGLGPDPNPLTFTTTQTARDASITLDGLTVTRASNTVNDLLPGMSLSLIGTGSGEITLASDNATIVKNIQSFATAYNDVMDFTHAQMAYTKGQSTQPLFGNSTLLNIQQGLNSIVSGPVDGLPSDNGYTSLSQVGVTTDVNNRLNVDTAKLTQALSGNATGVRRLFTPNAQGTYTYVYATGATVSGVYDTQVTSDANGQPVMQMRRQGTSNWITMTQSGNTFDGPAGGDLAGFAMEANNIHAGDTGTMNVSVGIAEKLSYRTGFYTEYSSQGAIYNEQTSLTKRNDDYQKQIDTLNMRIKKKSDDLTAKYARLESLLATLKGQSSYLSQQLSTLPSTMQGRVAQRMR
ncbi:MAG: flagellar filament capping protein FliD [Nitrospinae bacterium]|nr:flagellar filament capping protein FliD [Nitrospinota bacterium]